MPYKIGIKAYKLFESGMEQQIFQQIENAVMFMVQDDAVPRRFIEPSFTIQYDITFETSDNGFLLHEAVSIVKT